MNLNKDSYIVNLTCNLESTTPLIINLTDYELNLLKFIENLSNKLSKQDKSRPYLTVNKFPYEEYKKRKLSNLEQQNYKEVLNENKKAYTKIKHEVEKQRKAGRI